MRILLFAVLLIVATSALLTLMAVLGNVGPIELGIVVVAAIAVSAVLTQRVSARAEPRAPGAARGD